MAIQRPLTLENGNLREIETGDAVPIFLRAVESPDVEDLVNNELVLDTSTGDLIIKIDGFLYFYGPKPEIQTFIGRLLMDQAKFSHWIGVMV